MTNLSTPPTWGGCEPSTSDTPYCFQLFKGAELRDALQGSWDEGVRASAPTHRAPTVRYWQMESPALYGGPAKDGRLFFAACTEPTLDTETGLQLRSFAALLEAETSPYDADELWVKYVSTDPAHQCKGLAGRLLQNLIAHARSTGQRLAVSYATDEGRTKFQRHLARELNASGLRWTQSKG